MSKYLLHIILFLATTQFFYAQENGVVALVLPVRTSLKFNKYAINPTFSFVREQNKYITFTNKREWVQFDDAPQTYLFSYSGRFAENRGMGIGLFQQDYGVLTTFGGIVNYAYNVVLDRDSNLTFGANLGFYQSGINEGRVVSNYSDPALQNIPNNSILTLNPGINYGTTFLDFGLAINNIVAYNLKSSSLLEENPEQGLQAHVMYTGFMDSRGFFDESKFSTLIQSEFKKDKTILSGLVMIAVPKGIWAQAGYNTLYGMSAGLGINISNQIAIEYNYEKAMGDLSTFGNSHEFTIAYKFKKRYRYNYSDEEQEEALLIQDKRTRQIAARRKANATTTKVDREALAAKRAEERALAQARLDSITQAKIELRAKQKAAAAERIEERKRANNDTNGANIAQAVIATEVVANKDDKETEEAARLKAEQEEQARLAEAARLKAEQEEQARLAEAARLKAEQEEQARLAEAARFKAEQEEQARLAEDARLKAEQEEQARLAEAARLKAEQEEQARLAEAERLKAEQEEQARLAEAERLKAEQEEQARLAEAARLKAEQEEQARLAEAAKLKAEQEEQARLAEAARLKAEQEEQQRVAAEKVSEVTETGIVFPEPEDSNTDELLTVTKLALETQNVQKQLMIQLNEVLIIKEKDLKDLKKENDLSEQGIVSAPKPFKSLSAENARLESIKLQLDNEIKSQDEKIIELEALYSTRLKEVRDKRDETNMFYSRTIKALKENQFQTIRARENVLDKFESVREATEIERKRRIKRALYDNEEDRYNKDRAALSSIKKFTKPSQLPLSEKDFDYGEELTGNIRIVKDVKHVESGYYLVVAVHTDVAKRDQFLQRAIEAGETNIDFFFDVNTSKYYIYYDKFDSVEMAKRALDNKGPEPLNSKMSMVKIENN
ncbi:PorP/SprF family type IX secretion system membrane protein [Aestuariibaculum marinum]|uniref:PorP/SprF family type IX secretion system membrane protein n=1 Tax=Aestuariibaculum marinum TaxID=2683592 RepID=A0A8J6PNP0_9FLAO|nr:PorP/SprF family type IX secretion system membrane protein [Aestuariibaculum marinum]MBD0822544.1 PorP/SprF family type IX secretion system membrane protein [Aestuariibaculum marinum]